MGVWVVQQAIRLRLHLASAFAYTISNTFASFPIQIPKEENNRDTDITFMKPIPSRGENGESGFNI